MDRYVLRVFVSSYLILLLVGIGIYVFADILFNLDEYTEDPNLDALGVLYRMADYHLYRLPLYFYQLGGVIMAIAAAFTFAMMLGRNELTPLIAAGVPLQRLAVPVLLCAVVFAAVWLANTELLIPRHATKIARRDDDLGKQSKTPVHCVRDDRNAILTAAELHAEEGWLKGVYIIEPDEEGNPDYLIAADYAWYDAQRKTWRFRPEDRGRRLVVAAASEQESLGPAIRWELLDEYAFDLTPEQILLRQSSQWAELMSFQQMNAVLEARNLPNLAAVAKARDIRFTQPLLMWILILLAIPFFLTREPTNVLLAGGKALLLTGACYGFTFLCHSMASETALAPLAVALPVLVFGPVAVLHLANAKT
jgi:lipopolysaccharide export system permease protein